MVEGAVAEWQRRVVPIACLGLVLSLLAGCGGSPPRHRLASRHGEAAGGGDFMGVTQARCAQGDAGACRILSATGR